MSFWAYLESWDYLAVILFFFCLWLGLFGAPKMKAVAPDKVDVKALRDRAYVGAAVAVAYLAVHYYLIKEALGE